MNILKNKNLLGGIAAVAVAALVYYLWMSGGGTPLLTSTEGTSPLSQQILTTLSQLHTLKLDSALFKDPVFVSLNYFGAPIPEQQAGRRNPFAPVGGSAPAALEPTP